MFKVRRELASPLLLLAVLAVTGCAAISSGLTHIQDLRECQPSPQGPALLTEHGGWDHRSVDEVRCTNEELKAVKIARELRESNSLVQ